MLIPLNVILVWAGNHAAIPTNWTRETSLDGKFLKGAVDEEAPNSTGGSDTHSHTSPAHTHNLSGHTHTGNTSRDGGVETDGGGTECARDAHIHAYTTSSTSGGDLSDAISYQSTSSLPPYHEVIFIKPNSQSRPLPDETIALFNSSTIPTSWDICDGAGGTPNLNAKYLRGAATSQNAGSTGGSLNHSHTVTHGHGAVGHTHSGTTGLDSDSGNVYYDTSAGGGAAVPRHTHTITLSANSETPANYSGSAGSAETVEPKYKKVLAIQNNTGSFSKPKGIIGMWLGALADIPRGWFVCNGENDTPNLTDYYAKITTSTGELGDTGGANTHTHAASNSHTHTAPGTHSHSGTTDTAAAQGHTGAGGGQASLSHSHTADTCSSQTSSWQSTTISANSSNNEPAYRTVAYIQFKREFLGGIIFFNQIMSLALLLPGILTAFGKHISAMVKDFTATIDNRGQMVYS